MTLSEFYLQAKKLYTKEKGERFFSFSLLWACICEKHGLLPSARFSDATANEGMLGELELLLTGYPLQYYLGYWDYMGKSYLCRENVLIPREDTEILSRYCAKVLPDNGTLLDFCCGSGCVGISVMALKPNAKCLSFDISPDALSLTKDNALRLKVDKSLTADHCDIFSEKASELISKGEFDVFCANPPYIPSAVIDSLEENVKKEPRLALDGGTDGLDFYRRIKELYLIRPDKIYAFEIGYEQEKAIRELFCDTDASIDILRDLSQNPRVCTLTPTKMFCKLNN